MTNDVSATMPSVMTMISADSTNSVRIAPADLVLFKGHHIATCVDQGVCQLGIMLLVIHLGMQKAMSQLLDALVAEKAAAQHQKRRNGPGDDGADQHGRWDQHQLVLERAEGDRPNDGEFPLGPNPENLLRVQREIVSERGPRFTFRTLL